MDDAALIARIAASTMQRRGITWTPGTAQEAPAREAAAAAISIIRKRAGNPELSFEDGDDYDLAVIATWYGMDGRRAEFLAEYREELNSLRQQAAVDAYTAALEEGHEG